MFHPRAHEPDPTTVHPPTPGRGDAMMILQGILFAAELSMRLISEAASQAANTMSSLGAYIAGPEPGPTQPADGPA